MNNPIGIFDSGVGGLTVLDYMRQQFPHENMIYIGDNAHCPYGDKTKSQLLEYTRQICDYFAKQHVKMIVLACNTTSANVLDELQKLYPHIPIVGVIHSTVHEFLARHHQRVLVIATSATIQSHKYRQMLLQYNPELTVYELATPRLVPVIESGEYKYGIQEGEIVTLTPAAVVDYLDKNLGFEQSDNTDWKQITLDELNNLSAVKISDTDYLNAKMILYTDKTAKALKPTETVSVNLNVSKILTSSEDLTFDNDAEVVKITPPDDGNTPPVVPPEYPLVTPSEQIQIVPSTGANMDYLTPTIIGVVSLVILGIGVVIVKKEVINK